MPAVEIHLREVDLIGHVLPPFLITCVSESLRRRTNCAPEFLANVRSVLEGEIDFWLRQEPGRAAKRRDRTRRVAVALLSPMQGELLALRACQLLLQGLLNEHLWWYETGGPFDVAYGAFVRAVEAVDENDVTPIDVAARNHTLRMRKWLTTNGYYTRPSKLWLLEPHVSA